GISGTRRRLMRSTQGRVGLIAAAAALIGAAACNRTAPVVDDGLVRDLAEAGAGGLELAPTAARPQVVVSPIEAGPTSAPKRAAPKRVPSPSPRPTTRVAAKQRPAPTPSASPAVTETAPVAEPRVQPSPAPVARPAPAPTSQGRVYKTEAQVFRDMPWIRP
ncbi:MAG: hypothetical protein ACM3SX_21910, partial [Deltaproteobacteria bacterium]